VILASLVLVVASAAALGWGMATGSEQFVWVALLTGPSSRPLSADTGAAVRLLSVASTRGSVGCERHATWCTSTVAPRRAVAR